MRKLLLTCAATLVATASFAGSVVMTPPAVEMAEPHMNNGSGAWLIPLAIIAILALTLTNDNGNQLSDSRLKENILPAGIAPNGLPLYTYNYIGGSQTYLGVMAQDVIMHTPEAITYLPGGYMAVDYDMLGLTLQTVN